jgi:serine/threonine-protein kinase
MLHSNGTILVADFGLAHMTESAATSALLLGGGTFGYMAPEQARGEKPTVRTDIYALGIVLFEMLTGGERPFTGEASERLGTTRENVLWEQLNLAPPSLRRWNSDITDRLEQIVQRCLAIAPEERYGSTLDLLDDLEAAMPGDRAVVVAPLIPLMKTSAASTSIVPPARSAPLRRRSWRVPLALGAIVLIALLTGLILSDRLNGSVGREVPTLPAAGKLTESPTATLTATATATATDTATATTTSTHTATPSATATATATLTFTPTRRPTLRPRTSTPTAEPSVVPTAELTATPQPTERPATKPPRTIAPP